jgi:hypothetical protein
MKMRNAPYIYILAPPLQTMRVASLVTLHQKAILTRLEAAFRTDFDQRCRRRKRDAISRDFRVLRKTRGLQIGLETDIFDTWRKHLPELGGLIGDLRGAFKFRHWLAHGRYWFRSWGGDTIITMFTRLRPLHLAASLCTLHVKVRDKPDYHVETVRRIDPHPKPKFS